MSWFSVGQRRFPVVLVTIVSLAVVLPTAQPSGATDKRPVDSPAVSGPIPGSPPGDPSSPVLEETYPFFSTWVDLESAGFVEEEYLVTGQADAYDTTGELVGSDVPYQTRIVVRRPTHPRKFNGTVLAEWQNVTAGYDIDALWGYEHILREGYAWVGISAQRVGVDQLAGWSPTRYGDLDVTGTGQFTTDELSYDIFAQAAKAVSSPGDVDPMGGLDVDTVLAIGGSQSASRMVTYYDFVLPQVETVFDGYAFVVGPAPTRAGDEPVFQVLSETDVDSPDRPADTDQFRRWEVAGAGHSGYNGRAYRDPLSERDLGGATEFECDQPPFSRVPLQHVTAAAYDHLTKWVKTGQPPPVADPIEFEADGTIARDGLGLARGGIRLSQVEAPTALNTGDNSGASFCLLFGSYVPFDDETLAGLYPSHGRYVAAVARADRANVRDGFVVRADAKQNLTEAIRSDIGKRKRP